jgi:peptidyl-prolyl cis-trans isomerase B (cyclophilin B)
VATKKERQRKLARDAHARRMQRHAERARRARQLSVAVIIVVLVVGVGFAGAAIAGVFGSSKPTAAASAHSPTPTPSISVSPSATPTPSPSVTSAMVRGKCVYTRSGTAARKVKLPPRRPDRKASYTATFTTNRGTIVVDLANKQAPCTVNSLVSLADQGYFNKTHCHRLVTSGIFVLQCGDPTGTGEGGPGYVFYSENLTGLKPVTVDGTKEALYPAGSVAMANTGQPDSNGSQFFFVYKNTDLPPSYTPFGTIVSGLNIIQNVAKAGSDNSNGAGDGHPKEKVQIDSVTITKT